MVTGSRFDGETQILPPKVRKTIQSIKEIVRNHSDADIYVMLQESNMDPNETTQKLLNQEPFHEVKKKRDKKKENTGYNGPAEHRKQAEHIYSQNTGYKGQAEPRKQVGDVYSQNTGYRGQAEPRKQVGDVYSQNTGYRGQAEPRKQTEHIHSQNTGYKGPADPKKLVEHTYSHNTGYRGLGRPAEPRKQVEQSVQETKPQAYPIRNSRRGGFTRNALPGTNREFRVVRDNRVNQNTNTESKSETQQCSPSNNVQVLPNVSEKSSKGTLPEQTKSGVRHSGELKSSPAINAPSDASARHARDATSSGAPGKALHEDTRASVLIPSSRVQAPKSHHSQQQSASLSTTGSVVGVYSSSSDPVHVPSPDSRPSGTVGAIKREVGVVGVRKPTSESLPKHPSTTNSSFSSSFAGKDLSASSGSVKSSTAITKNNQLSQATVVEPVMSSTSVSRSFLSNQYSSKPYQQLSGHQKASQPNMEWKPKSSQKSSLNPGIIGTAPATISPSINNSAESTTEDHLRQKLSQVEHRHVIIPEHLRAAEADRSRLIFGSFGDGLDSTKSFTFGSQPLDNGEQPNDNSSTSVADLSTSSEDVNQVDSLDDTVRNSGSDSPASAVASEHPLPEQKQSSSPGKLGNYVDIGLVRNNSPRYTPAEPQLQQEPTGLSSFAAYDPQTGYDVPPFFRPAIDESVRGLGLSSQQEALLSHAANNIPASTVAMMQQQQQPVAQLYPQVHVSHFPNFMPYRQILSPVYVPPMAVPGYSSNPAYPHPSNGSSYLLMPGANSHLAAGGLKYGNSQYKQIPTGSPTGFGSYTNPTGYAINAQGTVGGTGLEDSNRMKYKDGSLYIPNPQAETSEIWIQTPRELPGMQSAQYYNIPGQATHAAYLPSHTGHAPFNAAAAQTSHVQFPGLYHPSQQPTAIANPHHLVPSMGGNVGVGVAAAAPGAQVGAYQQAQMGHHMNWAQGF